jgi:hypothetical protein
LTEMEYRRSYNFLSRSLLGRVAIIPLIINVACVTRGDFWLINEAWSLKVSGNIMWNCGALPGIAHSYHVLGLTLVYDDTDRILKEYPCWSWTSASELMPY